MNVQVIMREGQPEYAVLPWSDYQALLQAATKGAGATSTEQAAHAVPAVKTELSALRQACGLSQEDLARSVGISPHYLAMLESGEREIEGAIGRALARALQVSGWEGES